MIPAEVIPVVLLSRWRPEFGGDPRCGGLSCRSHAALSSFDAENVSTEAETAMIQRTGGQAGAITLCNVLEAEAPRRASQQ